MDASRYGPIAAKHDLGPNQVSAWKRQAKDGLEEVFTPKLPRRRAEGRLAVDGTTGRGWRRKSNKSARIAHAVNLAARTNPLRGWKPPKVDRLNEPVAARRARRAQRSSRLGPVKRPRKTSK